MSTATALWAILIIACVTNAVAAALSWEFAQEMKRAKKNLSNYAALGCLTAAFGLATVCLWWFYALRTNQVLLGVIPTVGLVWGWLTRFLIAAAKKGGAS